MVPKHLTEEQREARESVAAGLSEQMETNLDLLIRVITDDESWFTQYDPETKRHSS